MSRVAECIDCGVSIIAGNYCTRCLAVWHIENEVPDDAPCADFDEPKETC